MTAFLVVMLLLYLGGAIINFRKVVTKEDLVSVLVLNLIFSFWISYLFIH